MFFLFFLSYSHGIPRSRDGGVCYSRERLSKLKRNGIVSSWNVRSLPRMINDLILSAVINGIDVLRLLELFPKPTTAKTAQNEWLPFTSLYR